MSNYPEMKHIMVINVDAYQVALMLLQGLDHSEIRPLLTCFSYGITAL